MSSYDDICALILLQMRYLLLHLLGKGGFSLRCAPPSASVFVLLHQYSKYFCTSKASYLLLLLGKGAAWVALEPRR